MRPVFTFDEIREAEKNIIEKDGVPSLLLMENAGKNAFDVITVNYPDIEEYSIYIFCGKGNNAGDGFVIARHFAVNAIDVNIIHVSEVSSLKGDALTNYELLAKLNSEFITFYGYDEFISSRVNPLRKGKILVIDAILGSGISGKVSSEYENAISFINSLSKKNKHLKVVAVDVPSGLMSGELINPLVKADLTITTGALKTEMLYGAGKECCGEIFVVPIGITENKLEEYNISRKYAAEMEDAASLLPKRKKSSYKYSNGKPLLIGGSKGMSGALIMSAMAAVRSGAGGVQIAYPESLSAHFSKSLFDAVKIPLNETNEQTISANSYQLLKKNIEKADAVLLGPGISLNSETKTFVLDVIANCGKNIVIDADALTVLGENLDVLSNRKCEYIILTPHLGEFSKLSGLSADEIILNRFESVRGFAKKYNVSVVMKSETTFSCLANGEIYFNVNGNESLAVGGSGDVLAGIIVSLLSQTKSVKASMLCGNFLQGMLAGLHYEKKGNKQTASQKDLIGFIPKAVTELLNLKK